MKVFSRIAVFALVLLFFEDVNARMTLDQLKNTLKPYKTSCQKKTGVDPALLEGTKSGNFPEDRNLMCFYRCLFQMMKIARDGEILIEHTAQIMSMLMPEEHVEEMIAIIKNCGVIGNAKEDGCEGIFTFAKCFYNTNSEIYFFP